MTENHRQELYCSLPMDMDGHQRVAVAAIKQVGRQFEPQLLLKSLLNVVDGPTVTKVLLPHMGWKLTKNLLDEDEARMLAVYAVMDSVRRYKLGAKPDGTD